jgi:hypothetical protein
LQTLCAYLQSKLFDTPFFLVLILGNHDGYSKSDENKMMSALSLGNPETAYAHQKPDRSQSFVRSNCRSP